MPAQHEGFGIVYLEGMANGLPALASAAGGAVELVTHGQNGYLITPGDTKALAHLIATLNNDRRRLAELGMAAQRTWLAHPTWDEMAERVRAFLLEMTC